VKPTRVPREDYPPRLARAPTPPDELWVAGHLDFSPRAVAVVGTRKPVGVAVDFTKELARALVGAGFAVASGGAVGIDATAHRAALDAGGKTWCVAPTGHEHTYPPGHRALFGAIAESGMMIWPFPPACPPRLFAFDHRNRVLATLAEAVVVVQAPIPSGALNAAKHARNLGRPLYVCPGPPWLRSFDGCAAELARGAAKAVASIEWLLGDLGARSVPGRSAEAHAVLQALSAARLEGSLHVDEIAARSGLPAHLTATALLTLALEDVVVEGPAGFFRRANPA
jgi:DNA processing protein